MIQCCLTDKKTRIGKGMLCPNMQNINYKLEIPDKMGEGNYGFC